MSIVPFATVGSPNFGHIRAMIELAGYIASILIGVSLGLVGGGGSTLAVPVLVYLLGVEPILATSYSLFIIGTTSIVGGARYAIKKLVDYKMAILFGLPSIAAVYLTRAFVLPIIPMEIEVGSLFTLSKSVLIMALFALLMLAASIGMIRKKPEKKEEQTKDFHPAVLALLVLAEGAVVGFLTGLVGAGGGFLIIPALVILAKLPMKKAVGTSLVIISSKSLIGFSGDLGHLDIDWMFLFTVSALAIVGIAIGSYLSTKIDGQSLKKGFGWLLLVMGIFIIFKQLF